MSWIGIDVAKHSFTAAQRSAQRFAIETFPMSVAGWRRFCQWAPENSFKVCLEATGPYWLRLAQWLEQAAIPYSVANPRKVRRFAQASEQRSKTDPIDATILVRFAETFELAPVSPETGPSRTLRALSRRILQLQIELNRERDRLEKSQADPATPESVLSSYAVLHNELQRLIDDLEHQAKRLILQHSTLEPAYQLLLSIPGIGEKTARTLMAEYGQRLLSASPKQMTRFAGLDVVLYESGSSVRRKPRISKQGNWRVRRALYMAALSAIRYNPTLAPYYQRKRQQGLQPKQALVAVMRRLLHLVYGVLKHQQPYDPDYKLT
jgi:transposase